MRSPACSSTRLGARGGVPLRLGDASTALIADRAGIELRWAPGGPPVAEVALPGLAAEIDGEDVPFSLPQLDPTGRLSGDVPWRALELLAGHVLKYLKFPWADRALDLLGWLPGEAALPGRLPLESSGGQSRRGRQSLGLSASADGSAKELASSLALAIAGPAASDLQGGALRGRGDALSRPSPFRSPRPRRRRSAARRFSSPPGPSHSTLPYSSPAPSSAGRTPSPPASRAPAPTRSPPRSLPRQRRRPSSPTPSPIGPTSLPASPLLPRAGPTPTDSCPPTRRSSLARKRFELAGVGFSDLTAVPLDQLRLDAGPGTIFVVGPLGGTSWAAAPSAPVIDLSTPGLAPEAFDLSIIASQDGPCSVRLPTRADAVTSAGVDGAAAQAARLQRVVDAVVARVGAGGTVELVAHGSAGHAAAAVAGTAGLTELITLGTPFGGVALDVLEAQPVAGALQLLAALQLPKDSDRPGTPSAEAGRALLAPLLAAWDATSPLADLAPPTAAPVIPPGLLVTCVRGRFDAPAVSRAISGLVLQGLTSARDALSSAVANPTSIFGTLTGGALGLGLGVSIDTAASPGDLRVAGSLALTGELLGGTGRPGLRRESRSDGSAEALRRTRPKPARGRRPHPVAPARSGGSRPLVRWHRRRTARALRGERSGRQPPPLGHRSRRQRRPAPAGSAGAGGTARSVPLAAPGERRGATARRPPRWPGPHQSLDARHDRRRLALSVEGVRRLLVDPAGLLKDAATSANTEKLASTLAPLLLPPPPPPPPRRR